jgi:hypothetical protein
MTTFEEIQKMPEWVSVKLVLNGLDPNTSEEGIWAYDATMRSDDLLNIVMGHKGMIQYITDDGDVFYNRIDNVQTVQLSNPKFGAELKRS